MRAPQDDLPPPDGQKEKADLPANCQDPLTRRRSKFPSKDTGRHPDGVLLPSIFQHSLEAETDKSPSACNIRTSTKGYLQQEMKEGEDIQLVLDVLVRGAKGMVEEGVTNDPWHYENVSESNGEDKAGNAWTENRPETTLKNIDNVKLEDEKIISCKNRTAEWPGGTLQQESRNNSSQKTEGHPTQYAPTGTNEKYSGYNTDLNGINGDPWEDYSRPK